MNKSLIFVGLAPLLVGCGAQENSVLATLSTCGDNLVGICSSLASKEKCNAHYERGPTSSTGYACTYSGTGCVAKMTECSLP